MLLRDEMLASGPDEVESGQATKVPVVDRLSKSAALWTSKSKKTQDEPEALHVEMRV